jgi:UDP-2,3-diacylglucosamine hydrolase
MTRSARAGDLAFIGDVHLDRDDPALGGFLAFLHGLSDTASRVVLLGDLFNVWIGGAAMERPHQTAVVRELAGLRRRGVVVRYLEGNRDYRIGRHLAGTAFDDASDTFLVERLHGLSIYATHGDRVNVRDRQYRLWRSFSRSAPVWALFGLLPARRRAALVDGLERRMRGTNLAQKRRFPEELVRAFGAERLSEGHDAVVLGHFHVEQELRIETGRGPGRVYVLPEWRESRRHLVLRPDGEMGFVDS